MTNRAGIVCAAALSAAGMALLSGPVRAAGAQLIQVSELADVRLGIFHNALFRYSIDQIVDDHGVRFGSLGSDIFHDPVDSPNEFWTVTDRGPNGNPGRRTFVVPKFDPEILHVRVKDGGIAVMGAWPIVDASDIPVTGVSNIETFDEAPYDFSATSLIAYNVNGLDTEGIVRLRDGSFWLVDEYSPSLVHINAAGRVLDRYVPEGSLLASTLATTPNYRVQKVLPRILNFRWQNRGFEGIAVTPDERTLFIAMQSPLEYPTRAPGRASRNVRILRFDIATERVTGEFVYVFDEVCAFSGQPAGCSIAPDEMKISGMSAVSATALLVDERTDPIAKVYRVDLNNATNILGTTWDSVAAAPTDTTPALETLPNPATQGIVVLPKTLVVDLAPFGLPTKIEGITLVRPDVLAVANDNDFGLVDTATFDGSGRLSNDTQVKSRIWLFQLTDPQR